jgi:hypothetical protein
MQRAEKRVMIKALYRKGVNISEIARRKRAKWRTWQVPWTAG